MTTIDFIIDYYNLNDFQFWTYFQNFYNLLDCHYSYSFIFKIDISHLSINLKPFINEYSKYYYQMNNSYLNFNFYFLINLKILIYRLYLNYPYVYLI